MEKPTSSFTPRKKSTIADVPSCVFDEIFIRLPIPDLHASILVCRDWNNSILDKQFVEKVKLHHASEAKVCMHDMSSPGNLVILKIDEEYITTDPHVAALPYVDPVLPVDAPCILGSVHDNLLFGNEQGSTLFIVNPSSRTCLEIADPTLPGQLYGLVYNKVKNNYYIVKLVQRVTEDSFEDRTDAFIYSLRRGTWRTKRLRNFKLVLSKSLGTLNGKLYFCDLKNIVIFNHSMKEFRLIPFPLELREQDLKFGVAREKLKSLWRQEQVMDILLISCYNYGTGLTSLWRLRKIDDVEAFETLAVWGGVKEKVQPISYLIGDPNRIVLLVQQRSIQVYNLVDQSRTEIYRDRTGKEHWIYSDSIGVISAIGFYSSFVPADLRENVVTIKTSGTKRNRKDQPKEDAHALKKLKQD